MEGWNRDDWQGRRKEQYESSAMFFVIAAAGVAVLSVIYLLTKLF
jgi:hypothetical protein